MIEAISPLPAPEPFTNVLLHVRQLKPNIRRDVWDLHWSGPGLDSDSPCLGLGLDLVSIPTGLGLVSVLMHSGLGQD